MQAKQVLLLYLLTRVEASWQVHAAAFDLI